MLFENLQTSKIKIFKKLKKNKSYPFSNKVISVFDKISKRILSDKSLISLPDVFSFGFWCRKNNLKILKKKFNKNKDDIGVGLIFHVPSSNIPVLPLYSLAFGVLTGNSNIIRIPKQNIVYLKKVISVIREEFKSKNLHLNNLFISYNRDEKISKELSLISNARMIWGSDKTIQKFKNYKTKQKCKDLMFGDKYSIAIFHLENKDKKIMPKIIKKFYNDTFVVDQNACSSPSIIFWYRTEIRLISLFWKELNKLVLKQYKISYGISSKRFEYLNDLLIKYNNISLDSDEKNTFFRLKIDSNLNYKYFKGFAGIFFERHLESLKKFKKILNNKMQTLSFYGLSDASLNEVKKQISKKKSINRIVEIGRTLEMDFIWDGKNVYKSLTKKNVYQ